MAIGFGTNIPLSIVMMFTLTNISAVTASALPSTEGDRQQERDDFLDVLGHRYIRHMSLFNRSPVTEWLRLLLEACVFSPTELILRVV